MSTQQYSEYLQETLLHLEQARRRETQLRQESDAILADLSALLGATTRNEVLSILRNTFRTLTGCDDCGVRTPIGDHLYAENNIEFPVYSGFTRVMKGGVLNAFDVTQVPEWKNINTHGIRSAMHLPLNLSSTQGMLILSSTKPAAFSHKSTELARRIIPLTEQALAKIEQIEQVHATQMEKQWQLMRLIMDHAPIGIFMLNINHKVMFVNQAFCQTVGVTEKQFIQSEHYSDVLPAACHSSA